MVLIFDEETQWTDAGKRRISQLRQDAHFRTKEKPQGETSQFAPQNHGGLAEVPIRFRSGDSLGKHRWCISSEPALRNCPGRREGKDQCCYFFWRWKLLCLEGMKERAGTMAKMSARLWTLRNRVTARISGSHQQQSYGQVSISRRREGLPTCRVYRP